MDVAALAAGLDRGRIDGDPDVDIGSLACNTRDVAPGSLFFCIPGLRADGHDFAPQAVAAGAVALVCERPLALPVTQVLVPAARHAMALMSARFYGDPTRELRVVAVTGTNGKTTTAHLLAEILTVAGLRPALLGTVVNRIAGVERNAKLTTAESMDLQRMFREMVDGGDLSCVMEASSHALALERTTGIAFEAAIFTNLSRDHLDFHPTLDAYFAAKRSLFLPGERRLPGAAAVVNAGDEHGRRLIDECRAAYGADLWTYAVEGETADGTDGLDSATLDSGAALDGAAPDCAAVDLSLTAEGSSFTLVSPRLGLREALQISTPARFNVANALAAAAAALAMGLPFQAVREGLANAAGVPGRVEPVRAGQPFGVLVDYSHTPDSLANVLRAVRSVTAGRLLTVFGCGGDRDRGKRPLMGAVAAELTDLAVVTSDNPRSEEPLAIIAEVLSGIADDEREHVVVEPDRRAAIRYALREARAGDALVIAGKGHEAYQILGPETIHFDDREVAADELAELGFTTGDGAGGGGRQGELVIPLTLEEAAAACGSHLEAGDPRAVATGVATDSRAVAPGDLFVALRGESFNGGDFAGAAIAAGAIAAVVPAKTASAMRAGTPRIVVDDGQRALGDLAAAVRRRSNATVVAVTGSVGKTSTKDILAALLAPVARVVATSGNHNNEIGVPLTVLQLEPATEVLVCELAMRGRGQIAELAAIVKPDVGVITNIAPVHLELVGTIEEVAAAKAEIIAEVGKGGLVVPADEALLEPHLRYHTGRLVTFGGEGADVCVVEAQVRGFATHALIDAFGRRAAFDFSFSGGQYLRDALAAIGAFIAVGFNLEEAKPGARSVEFSALRGRLEELPGGGLLLNDAYNANPLSMKAAIDHLCEVAGERPRVAVLGDMFELGAGAAVFHREVGRYADSRGVRVLAVGELARDYLAESEGGVWYATVEECLAALPGAIAPGSAILVKASRALRLERVAEAILAGPAAPAAPAAPADDGPR